MTAVSSRRYRAVFVAFMVAAALLVAPAEPAGALDFNVNNQVACSGAGPTYCLVSEALAVTGPGDTIIVAAGTYVDPGLSLTQDITIRGAGAGVTILDAASVNRGAFVSGATVVIEDLTMTNGVAPAFQGGGAIRNDGGANLTLRRVELIGNDATSGGSTSDNGGAIFQVSGSLLIEDSVINGNTAEWIGGGVAHSGGDVTIRRTTISNNDSASGGGGFGANFVSAGSTTSLENVTVSGNTAGATSGLDGGGLYFFSAGTVSLNNVTVTDNVISNVGNGGGGMIVGQNDSFTATSLTMSNTIIAGNTAGGFPDCRTIGGAFTITTLGNNIMGVTDGCFGYTPDPFDQTGDILAPLDAVLGPLADNGGLTLTHALLTGSPAIDNGSNGTCELTDQRGIARPQGTDCDIGAFELVPSTGVLQALIDGASNNDVVLVPPGTYNETITVDRPLTLRGDGGTVVVDADGQPVGQAVTIDSPFPSDSVVLDGFEIANASGNGVLITDSNESPVVLENSTVRNNSSASIGAGIRNDSGVLVTLDNTDVYSNIATTDGGGIYANGDLDVVNGSRVYSNVAGGDGGGIFITNGDLTLDASDVGIVPAGFNSADRGGGIYVGPSANAIIANASEIRDNQATTAGGGIYVGPGGTADITGLTVIDGNQQGIFVDDGGSAFVAASFITNNAAVNGGGAYLASGGDLWIQSTDVIGNSATESGGAVYAVATLNNAFIATSSVNFQDNEAADTGGAIAVSTSDGPVECSLLCVGIYGVQFSNNSAVNGGGALHVMGDGPDGSVYVDDTTFIGNSATDLTSATGGAILKEDEGQLTIGASTFTSNSSAGNGGAIGADLGVLNINGTIISNNTAADDGGGIWINDPCGECGFVGGTIDFSFIESNQADRGAGIRVGVGADVTITNTGFVTNQAGTRGGGASVRGVVTVSDSPFAGNSAAAEGGALSIDQFGDATLLAGASFTGNSATDGGAIFSAGTLDIGPAPTCVAPVPDFLSFAAAVTFDTNPATNGGAIYNEGDLTVSNTEFLNNSATGDGGAIYDIGDFFSVTTVECSMFFNNAAGNNAGAYYGNTAANSGTQDITSTSFFDNTAVEFGGAMLTTSSDTQVTNSLFDTNSADVGGAIYNDFVLTVTESTLVGNQADSSGAGIHSDDTLNVVDSTISGGTALEGGGIWSLGPLTVSGSTIEGNVATSGTGTVGGGIFMAAGAADIVNSTISGNNSAGNGGGLGMSGGTATINNTSFVGNVSTGQGAAFNGDTGSSILISNSLAANNAPGGGGPNCDSLTSLGYNLLGGNGSGCTLAPTDIIGDAQVGPLADNGGPTQTHLLLPGSPAIDAASSVIDYTIFDGTTLADWQLNGFTDTASGGDLLLAAGTFNAGSAFITEPVPVDQDFTAQFTFQIAPDPANPNQNDAADGITFTISDDPSWLGTAGGFLGIALYDQIDTVIIDTVNGVSVEFDTWVNGAAEGANDPGGNEDHVGININGNLSSQALTIVGPNGTLSSGTWTAWVDYDVDTTTLEVRVADDGIRPASPTVSTVVDIAALTGPDGYLGFTGATGIDGISGSHRIQSFTFGGGSSCEPTDQRGVVRPQGDGCDIGAVEVDPSGGALTVNLELDGNFTAGSPVIPIDDLDVGTFFGGGDQPSSTQLGAIQLGAIQLGAIGSDLTTAAGYLTIGSIIEAAAELSAVPTILDEITLVDVPIVGGWESILALSSNLAGRPPYTVSLQAVINDPDIQATLSPPLTEYRLADSGVTASQLGAIQLGAIQLGAIQLGAIQLGAIQLGAIGTQLEGICAPPEGTGTVDCGSTGLGIDPSNSDTYDDYSIMALTLLGVDLDFAQLGAIQLGAIDPSGTQLGAIQLGAIQLGAIDTAAGTIGNTQLGAIQLGAIQLGAIQLGAIQLGAIGSKANLVDYWCNDPLGGLDCGDLGVTEPSTGFEGDELDGYTILALGAMGADLEVLQLGAIQLGAIANLESTQLGAIQLGAIQLGAIDPADTQLGAIQLGAIQLGAIQLGAIDWDNVVFTQLGAIQLGAIQLGAIDVDGSVSATQLGAIQLGAIGTTAAQLGAIVNCVALAGGCEANLSMSLFDLDQAGVLQPGATLADLAGALEGIPLQVLADQGFDIVALVGDATLLDLLDTTTIAELPPDLTLGELAELWLGIPVYELLLALLDPADLAWEDVDAEVIAAENPALTAGFSIGFQLTGDPAGVPEAEFPFTADVSVTLPEGVSYVPGSSFLAVEPDGFPPTNSVPLVDPEIDGTTARWIVEGVQLNQLNYLQFTLDTALTADAGSPIAASVSTLGLTADDEVPTLVPDLEPQNNDFDTAPLVFEIDSTTGEVLIKDVLTLGRIDPGDDIDLFKFEDLPAGASIEVYLNPGDSDLDIVLFEPGVYAGPQLRGPIERVVDGSLDPTVGVDPNEQDQESLDDIANTDTRHVFKASLHRDNEEETIVTPPLREGGDYFLQISGYQLAQPSDVYVGRIRVLLPPDAEACSARPLPFDGDGTPGTLPSVAGAETIYLINQELFANTYGAAALTSVLDAIDAIHDPTSGVGIAPAAAVIPVEADPGVATAYASWLTADGNCSVNAANLVAQEVAELVDSLRADPTTDIQSVVIVGGDDQIPFFRVPDETTIANEREYETTFSGNNPLDAALRGGFVLSDAPMVDFNPLYVEQGNREIFVQTIPVGRLVEEPVEIVASLDQYLLSGGLLDLATATPTVPATAEVLGYDFLTDSSLNIYDELANQGYVLPTDPLEIHINENWTSADLGEAFDAGPDVLNVNAHYDHTAALSAAESLAGTFNDLYTVDDLDPMTSSIYAGSTIYGMGCHAGLNAPGSYLNPTDDLYDWAQALLGRQAIYIANTGFGYGDSDFQAYSEELMALLTEQLGAVNTIGEAHLYAAQLFTAQTPKWSPYHDKALMEATLYGLPFYALREFEAPVAPTPDVEPIQDGTGDLYEAGLAATSNNPSDVDPYIEERTTDDGNYFEADDVLAVPFRPVEPLEYIGATPNDPNLTLRGAIVEGGVSRDIGNFDALYARPILYDQDVELEYETIGAFPNALQAVTSYELPGGRADRVLLSRGRYSPDSLTQQIWDEVSLTAYYGQGPLTDVTPPQIDLITAVDQGGGNVVFTVDATDDLGGDVLRVLILYKESGADGAWLPLELTESGGVWTGTALIPAGAGNIDFSGQVLGADGQVSSSTDKAELHEVLPPSAPELTLSGPLGNNGIYTGAVTATLTTPANAPNADLEISVNGGPFVIGTTATITTDGAFTVVGRLADFEDVTVTTSGEIDTGLPTVTVEDPSAVVEVAQGDPLPLRYFCTDPVDPAGYASGIAKCEGTKTNGGLLDTSVLGLRTAQVTATDRAGNVTTVPVTYIVSQLEPVTITVDPSVVAINTDVTFTAVFNSPTGNETIEWWFGDGSDYLIGDDPDLTGTATTVIHPYPETGVYPVTVRVTDSSGAIRIGTFDFVVVYDPAGGFVTGGGWIDSPSGAFTPDDPNDPDLVGKANFGFVSKYKKGQTIPTGNTVFEFEAGDLEFSSTSYDWLVVQGDTKASFKGEGVIEGWEGVFKFRVTIRDADPNENDGFEEDAFRIQIWQELPDGSEWVVYDSGLGTDPDSSHGGTTELGGGSIVIHKGGNGGGGKKK